MTGPTLSSLKGYNSSELWRRRSDSFGGSTIRADTAFDAAGGSQVSPEQNGFYPGVLGVFGFAGRLPALGPQAPVISRPVNGERQPPLFEG